MAITLASLRGTMTKHRRESVRIGVAFVAAVVSIADTVDTANDSIGATSGDA